jgi:hypothetical protein
VIYSKLWWFKSHQWYRAGSTKYHNDIDNISPDYEYSYWEYTRHYMMQIQKAYTISYTLIIHAMDYTCSQFAPILRLFWLGTRFFADNLDNCFPTKSCKTECLWVTILGIKFEKPSLNTADLVYAAHSKIMQQESIIYHWKHGHFWPKFTIGGRG